MIDYTNGNIFIPIVRGEVKAYASVNEMMFYEEEGLEVEGSYFVYLLHPKRGSTDFTIEFDYQLGRWISRDAQPWIEEDIMEEIIAKLPNKNTP